MIVLRGHNCTLKCRFLKIQPLDLPHSLMPSICIQICNHWHFFGSSYPINFASHQSHRLSFLLRTLQICAMCCNPLPFHSFHHHYKCPQSSTLPFLTFTLCNNSFYLEIGQLSRFQVLVLCQACFSAHLLQPLYFPSCSLELTSCPLFFSSFFFLLKSTPPSPCPPPLLLLLLP